MTLKRIWITCPSCGREGSEWGQRTVTTAPVYLLSDLSEVRFQEPKVHQSLYCLSCEKPVHPEPVKQEEIKGPFKNHPKVKYPEKSVTLVHALTEEGWVENVTKESHPIAYAYSCQLLYETRGGRPSQSPQAIYPECQCKHPADHGCAASMAMRHTCERWSCSNGRKGETVEHEQT